MSGTRNLADLLLRITRPDAKPDAPVTNEQPATPEEPHGARTEPPIPLRPGEVIELRITPESQEHRFAFEPGSPLPNRSQRTSPEQDPPTPTPSRPVPLTPIPAPLRQAPAALSATPPAEPAPPTPEAPPPALPPPAPAAEHAAGSLPLSRLLPLSRSLPHSRPVPLKPSVSVPVRKDYIVSNVETILKEAMQIDGAIGVALVDYTSGMTLGQAGGGSLNMDVAAAGNTEVVRSKLRTMDALGLRDGIEDILITLDSQYHLIRLISDKSGAGLFLYLALNKHKANLAMARHKLGRLERELEI